MNIYLIGMPGCGKSSVGKALRDKTGYSYVDLDAYIEDVHSMTIPKIFEEYGESVFRGYERDALKDFQSKDGYIVSCGGGIIGNINNKDLMNGKVVYINVDIDSLKERISNDKVNVRPMFKTKTVEELYAERKDKFELFKDITVLNDDVDMCAKSIIKELGL